MKFTVDEKISPTRLDVFLSGKFPDSSRAHVQKLISSGAVTVDGQRVKASFKLTGGEEISVADIAIVAGMGLMIYAILFRLDDEVSVAARRFD